jgi:hypothetical protein
VCPLSENVDIDGQSSAHRLQCRTPRPVRRGRDRVRLYDSLATRYRSRGSATLLQVWSGRRSSSLRSSPSSSTTNSITVPSGRVVGSSSINRPFSTRARRPLISSSLRRAPQLDKPTRSPWLPARRGPPNSSGHRSPRSSDRAAAGHLNHKTPESVP